MTIAGIEARLDARADARLQKQVDAAVDKCLEELEQIVDGFRMGTQTVDLTRGNDSVTMQIQNVLRQVAGAAIGHLTSPYRDAAHARFIARADSIIDEVVVP